MYLVDRHAFNFDITDDLQINAPVRLDSYRLVELWCKSIVECDYITYVQCITLALVQLNISPCTELRCAQHDYRNRCNEYLFHSYPPCRRAKLLTACDPANWAAHRFA